MGETLNKITIGELMLILAGLVSVYMFIKTLIVPLVNKWLKVDKNENHLNALNDLPNRVSELERHERQNYQLIQENEMSNKLLCKAMIALIDNRITNNNIDGLKLVKAELIGHITGG